MGTTYEKDVVAWAQEQAQLLRSGQLSALDIEHIAEEIEDVGKEQKVALQSHFRQILIHLLKLNYSPAQDPRDGWIEEIFEFRAQAESRIEDVPSLKHYADELFARAWPQARRAAVNALERYRESAEIPDECPYTIDQVMDSDFLPEQGEKYQLRC